MKKYTQAPLPFQGQKRGFIKEFREVLGEFPEDSTIVDVFGGSGLLSHTAKERLPNARVIYNDFDGYHLRVDNIDKTNALLSDLRDILANCGVPRDKMVKPETKAEIIQRIRQEEGFIDWITISVNILFSMNYVFSVEELAKESIYNKIRFSDYEGGEYLKGVELEKRHYLDIFEKYKDAHNVAFIVDPPYLSTNVDTYKRAEYWHLSDYLGVLEMIKEHSFFYFTSSKSQIVELLEWFEEKYKIGGPFVNSKRITKRATVTKNLIYEDNLIYKNVYI